MTLSSIFSIENIIVLAVFAVIVFVAMAFADDDRKRR